MESAGTVTVVTTTWTKNIVVGDDPWVWQNLEEKIVYAKYDDGTPEPTETGFAIRQYEGMASGTHGVGNLWHKVLEGTGSINLAK